MVTYCTANDVADFMQVERFTENTTPTKEAVEAMITRKEALIEERTMHAWKAKTVTDETHSIDYIVSYEYRDGVDVQLKHRGIRTLSSGQGDKLEVWNGSEWENYLSTRTEGRNHDFWLDYTKGILFIRTVNRTFRTLAVRVTYRYGDSEVDGEIAEACIKLVAADLARSDDRSILLPEGTSNVGLSEKAKVWKEEADTIIMSNREVVVI